VQFDVLTGLPEHATLTSGQAGECDQLLKAIVPDRFYVMDRGFSSYPLLAEILSAKSDFVVRLRDSAATRDPQDQPLHAEDRHAGVVADQRVTLGWRPDRTPDLPPLRRVEVHAPDRTGVIRPVILLTNRHDLPAWMIALIYRHRWQVELFFRWLKCVARLEHFFSESIQGMTLQIYATLIGMLLIAVETGARPSKYDYALLSSAFSGMAPLNELLAVAAKRRAERQRAAESERTRHAAKTAP
jgi:hypothetical protein